MADAQADRNTTIALAAGWAVSAAVLLANAWESWDTTVDDAWISARYAAHLAAGHGLTYSAGETPIEGYTNLLWTVFLALGELLGLDTHAVMTTGGYLWGVAALGALIGLTRALAPDAHPAWAIGAGLLAAINSHVAVICTNGLETAMFCAVVLGGAWATLAATGPMRLAAGVLVGLAGTVRPEGWVVAGALVLLDLWRHRDLRGVVGPVVAIGLVVMLWRQAVYGAWVPNTFTAKAAEAADHTTRNLRYLQPDLHLWVTLGVAALVAPFPPGKRLERTVLIGVAAAIIAIAFQVTLWMPGARLLVVAELLTLAAAVSAAASLPRVGAAVLAIPLITGLLWVRYDQDARVKRYDWKHSALPDNGAALAARHLAAHAPDGAWLAVRDAGVFAYNVGTDVRVAETHQRALTLPHVDGANLDLALVPSEPEFIVTTVARKTKQGPKYGNDMAVLRRTKAKYRYLGRVYQHYHRFYDVFVRDDVKMPKLPKSVVVNRKGAGQLERYNRRGRATRGSPAPPADP